MKTHLSVLFIALILLTAACKKKKDAHVPPDMSFKTGSSYTSGDKTINKKDSILVGIIVKKTEDDLKSYNVSYAYDGATTTTTFYNYVLSSAEANYYEKDIWIKSRNQVGTEKWSFTILDRDGNISQKSILLTVQ